MGVSIADLECARTTASCARVSVKETVVIFNELLRGR
jgi:hypothetical protein